MKTKMKHKIILSVCFILMALSGCSQGDLSAIEQAVKDRVNDPASTKFKNLIINKNSNKACIGWNSKNTMGGYGNWDYAQLKKNNSSWIVVDMQLKRRQCTLFYYGIIDIFENALKVYQDLELELDFKYYLDPKQLSFRRELKQVSLNQRKTVKSLLDNLEYMSTETSIKLASSTAKVTASIEALIHYSKKKRKEKSGK